MSAALKLREDYDGARLRALAKASDDANQTRRLLALAAIYDGSSRAEAARLGGVDRQSLSGRFARCYARSCASIMRVRRR